MRAALLLIPLALGACHTSERDKAIDAREDLLFEIRRVAIASASLGRFGSYKLLQDDTTSLPCRKNADPTDRACHVEVVGRGEISLVPAGDDLQKTGLLAPNVIAEVVFPADCSQQTFDFKTFDNSLPSVRPPEAPPGTKISAWENKLLRVEHTRRGEGPDAKCSVDVRLSESFAKRIRTAPVL